MIDFIFSVISNSDVPMAQQVLIPPNQMPENTTDSHVVMVDKVIDVSEVTCEKADALITPSQGPQDHIENLKLEVDRVNIHQKMKDQSSSRTKDRDILHCGSSVLGKKEEICKGKNRQVTDHC